ncbi:MAG TPA: hypothetical protein VK035_03615 [Kiloniellales bacterium]|nr:hypothetical protein [Kiloniellales bacterium]
MASVHDRNFLDGPYPRVMAGVVLVLVCVALLMLHWEDLFPPEEAVVAGDDPLSLCIAERTAEIDAMLEENPQMSSRRETMLARVAPMCADMVGEGAGGPPPLPDH